MQITTIEEWNNLISNLDSVDNDTLYDIAKNFEYGLEVNGETIVTEDKIKAFDIYQKAYQRGHIDSAICLADFYSDEEFCQKNIPLAKKLYKKGVAEKNSTAVHNLATLYRDLGHYSKAFKLYKLEKKYDKTHPIELAYCYYYGVGTKANKKKAFAIFQKITLEKKSQSMYDVDNANYYLGLYYLEGKIVKKSVKKARHYLNKANRDDDHYCANELLLIIGRK